MKLTSNLIITSVKGRRFVEEFKNMQEVRLPPGFNTESEEHWKSMIQETATRGDQGQYHCELLKNTNTNSNTGKISRMMLICLTSRIYAETGKNCFDIGRKVLEIVEDAVIIVRSGTGSIYFSRGNIYY